MNNKEKIWKAYISYYGDNIINDFNLKETDNIKLWNIKEDIGINKLNCHYANLVCAYYIWKNQFKSEYVCIWDHRRYLTPINFEKLHRNMIQCYYFVDIKETPFEFMIKEGVNEYIIWQFIKYMVECKNCDYDFIFNRLFNKEWGKLWYHTCFNCNWEVFNDVCEFMFGFVDYIMPNGTYDSFEEVTRFIDDMGISEASIRSKTNGQIINGGRIESKDRSIGAFYELILPLYCKFVGIEAFTECNDKKIGIEINEFDKDTILDDLKRWVSKNIFSGCRSFYIKTNNEELKNIVNNDWYYIYHAPIIFVNEFEENTIKLNIDEYIDVESPLDKLDINNIKTFNN